MVATSQEATTSEIAAKSVIVATSEEAIKSETLSISLDPEISATTV